MEGRGRRRSEGGTRRKGRGERLEEDLDGVRDGAGDGEEHRGREDDKLKSENRCRRESVEERKGAGMEERFREGWGQNGTDRDEKKSSSEVSSGVEVE